MDKNIPDVEVEESSSYENCVGVRETKIAPGNLCDFLEADVLTAGMTEEDWKKHWVGMPEFSQSENGPHRRIIISFRNEADYQEFATLIKQNLTEKTKSIWYPKLNREENSLMRWIED